MSARTALKWIAIVTGALPIVLVVLLAVVLFTESAAKSIWSFARGSVQGLDAAELSGRLIGPLEIRGLRFRNEAISVDVKHLVLDWQLEKLLFGELYVGTLYASDARIHSHGEASPETEENKDFELPKNLPLPIIIRLADTKVRNLAFQAGESEPLQLDTIRLRGQASSNEVIIRTLTLSGPQLEASAQASVQLWKNYQTDASLRWRYALEDIADTSGTLTAKGDLDGLGVSLTGDADDTRYGDYGLALQANASRQSVNVSDAVVNLKNSDTRLTARGNIGLHSQTPDIAALLEWQNMRWPLQADDDMPAQLSSQTGGLRVNGSLDQYSVTLNGNISTPQVPDGQLSLHANGGQHQLQISKIDLQALRGVANGTAQIDWTDELQSQFKLEGKGLDPGELFPEWPGSVSFKLAGEQTGSTVAIPTLTAEGIVRERPLSLQASARYDGATAHIKQLRFRSADSRLDASGSIGEQLDFNWTLDSPDLRAFLPNARGKFSSTGSLSGVLAQAKIDARINASNLRYDNYGLGAMDGQVALDLSAATDSSINLAAESLQIESTQIKTLQLDGSGRPGKHRVQLQADLAEAELDIQLQGGLENKHWAGSLNKADIKPARLAAWSLRDDVRLMVSAAAQSASLACWQAAAASFCFEGQRQIKAQAQTANAQVTIQDFALAYLQPLLSPDIEFAGTVSAQSEFSLSGERQWTGTAQVDTSAIQITANELAGEQRLQLLATEAGTLTAEGGTKGGQLSLQLPFVNGGGIAGKFSVDESTQGFANGALSGSLNLDVPELDIVAAFVPEIKALQGKLNADFKLAGTVANPEPTGDFSLNDGATELSTPGLDIHNIQIQASANRSGVVTYSGSARSDEGELTLDGKSVLGAETTRTELTLKGEGFQLWNTAEARVWASPDLTVSLQGNRVDVGGTLTVPKARVTPQELPTSAVDVSRDQLIILDTQSEQNTVDGADALEVYAKVGIALADDVRVEGFGFKGAIEGDLLVRQRPSKPLVASGELNIVDGEYRAYGQGLVIDRGQILFAGGAIENPGISVRALRRPAEGIVVGVNVRGELLQPELNLFSEPGMSQSDQLSWLVLGRPLQNASGAESDYITQAALALGIRGGNSFTKGIGDSLGVDTFAIQTGSGEAGAASDVNQAALVIGKYLTPKLYVSYGVGLLDAVNTVKLRYLMTDRWNLETESSAISSGGDISYSFEK